MPGSTISKSLNNGFAGTYARHPDMIVTTRVSNSDTKILFGTPCVYDNTVNSGEAIIPITKSFADTDFAGVTCTEVKSATEYINQAEGGYSKGEAAALMVRGSVSVVVSSGAEFVKTNDPVYIGITGTHVGKFVYMDVPDATVKALPNARYNSKADSNGVVELILLTRANA